MRLSLFRADPAADAAALYATVVAEARQPHWYRDAGIPDTLDGRFAVLTTLLALTDIRLERGTEKAQALGPRLAESFIADMDAQMREAGFGDPSLGKQVRMMVGSLASRVDRWRKVIESDAGWSEAVRDSLLSASSTPDEDAAITSTKAWWRRLQGSDDAALVCGDVG